MSKKINITWIVVGAIAGAALYLLLWWIFDCFACRAVDHLRNLIFLTGGITAAMIAAWRAQVADEQTKTADEQAKTESKKADIAERVQITDRFSRAIEQLNNDNMYMRIGAVHALERIGYDSEKDVLAVLRLLASFVRGQSPVKGESVDTIQPDAKDGLDAIGRLTSHHKEFLKGYGAFRLDLSASNLTPFPLLIEGYFRNFDFSNSNITNGVFAKHNFSGAFFSGANLTGTFFLECNFRHASFMQAILDYAEFNNADMSETVLHMATCNNTNFSTAKNMTAEMLKYIRFDGGNQPVLPDYLSQDDLPPPLTQG